MRISYIYPLLLLSLIFLFVWLNKNRLRKKSFWLRIIAMILLIFALTGPQIVKKNNSLDIVFALDASDSIPSNLRNDGLRFVEKSLEYKRENDRIGFVMFGEDALTQVPLSYVSSLEVKTYPSPKGTNIEKAIDLSNVILSQSDRNNRRVVLITDGNETDGSAIEASYRAREKDIRIDVYPIVREPLSEVAIEDFEVPNKVKLREPFVIKVIIASSVTQNLIFDLYQDGKKLFSQNLSVREGRNLFLFSVTPNSAGFHKFKAEVFPKNDTRIENNTTEAFTVVEGPQKILYVYNPNVGYGQVLSALKAQGIDLEVITSERIPDTTVGFSGYSTVILDDVSATSLTLNQMRAIQSFVRDAGGGLLVIGGPNSFGMGSYMGTPLEETLPVESRITQTASLSNIALVLVIDASGSMSGQEGELAKIDLAKESAQLVVDLLKDQDRVGVIAFDHSFQWVVDLTSAKEREGIAKKISMIQPGGGTAMYPPMESAYLALKNEKARVKHIIVLSDGQTEPGRFKSLVEQMRLSDITVSTIAIGSDADISLMRNIAEWGQGRFYYTNDIYSVPQIFLTETLTKSRPYLTEKPFIPTLNSYIDFLEGVDRFPTMLGYVSTSIKPKAKKLMSALDNEPLLAYWRYGLGKVLAFTSDSGKRWTKAWINSPSFSKFWTQAIRWLGQDVSSHYVSIYTSEKSNQVDIIADVFDYNGNFVNFLEGTFKVFSPSGNLIRGNLIQVDSGRYYGKVNVKEEGIYSLSVELKRGDTVINSLSGFYMPVSKELRDIESNNSLLYSIAEITGGRILNNSEDVFDAKIRDFNVEYIDIWQFVLLLSGIIFLSELVLRKLPALKEQKELFNTILSRFPRFRISTSSISMYENSYENPPIELRAYKPKEESPIRASSMEHAARLYIARLKQEREEKK
ncbi:MAG: VWA domain-containing protein [bacterium]|nr:VWA domain-containing protein [bacterium]